ncbi:cation:proton antiporter [Methanobrevibacter sp. 87.7]|uniref:MnhB domain-containing protein n=1 Tax=Methanobrevibacter sp. 87.7 TaxID=387957 RepID=UPI000B50F30D|nr:MnhB domain-containing protein [Methanobrevibacter sp. 87.7]OWT33144.1 cation:proton antiporter [Methanobrevibacter sp. 87.7]
MSPILKIFVLPASFIFICAGILTILGGHITPGGGFQGGAMISAGIILCLLVFGLEDSPIELSEDFISAIESIGALGYVILGLIGLYFGGSFLYNVGTDFYSIVPNYIVNIFHYPDVTNAGIVPYFNILVGLKVFVGLTAIVIAFMAFRSLSDEKEEEK